MSEGYLLPNASLEWQEGTPVSSTYEDIYWHRGAALEEKSSVFVEPALSLADPNSPFTVAELGFGFGINCLLTAEAWPENARLNFISIEKHPVSHSDLRKLLSGFDFRYADQLLSQYPPAYRGSHVIWLSPRIRLLLIFEDVSAALTNLDAGVDAWYLDGFAPSRNEDMWTNPIYRVMFARSRTGAIVSTYSAAAQVRRGLAAAGFEVERVTGFGRKKEMLKARRSGAWQPMESSSPRVAVIGAGLAGRYCTEALQRRELDVTVIDSGQAGPSTITQLAVFPQLALAAEARYRFSLAALRYMKDAPGFYCSGLRWIGRTPEEAERLIQIAAMFPDSLIEVQSDASVLFKTAGWLAPDEMPAIQCLPATVSKVTARDNHWICESAEAGALEFDQVIMATGFNRTLLPNELQVRAIRGQAISVPSNNIDEVLNSNATVFPTWQGRSIISGTYSRSDALEPSDEDTAELLADAAPLIAAERRISAQDIKPLVGVRAVSRDRLPIVGEAPNWAALETSNRVSSIKEFQSGLHFCTAFGSRGATHARLCAEHLVSKLLNEPAALGLGEQAMLSPARFTIRDRKAED